MAKIKSFPNNQDEYVGAEYIMKWLHGRTSGVFAGSGNASVTALPSPSMAVQVSDGVGWLSNYGQDGVAWWIDNLEKNGEKLQISVSSADGMLNRIDRVIVEWKTTNYVDLPEIKTLKGTAASNPQPPALTNNRIMRQISLARIRIPAGSTAITPDMIIDERLDESVCGLVTDNIEIDTSVIQKQFEALLKAYEDALADAQAGIAYELKKLKFEDISVSPAVFEDDPENFDENFPYRAAVALEGATGKMTPEVMFYPAQVNSGNFSGIAKPYTGGVYIYAGSVPDAEFNIATIILWR